MVGRNQAKANKLNHGLQKTYFDKLKQIENDEKKKVHAVDRELAATKVFLERIQEVPSVHNLPPAMDYAGAQSHNRTTRRPHMLHNETTPRRSRRSLIKLEAQKSEVISEACLNFLERWNTSVGIDEPRRITFTWTSYVIT